MVGVGWGFGGRGEGARYLLSDFGRITGRIWACLLLRHSLWARLLCVLHLIDDTSHASLLTSTLACLFPMHWMFLGQPLRLLEAHVGGQVSRKCDQSKILESSHC